MSGRVSDLPHKNQRELLRIVILSSVEEADDGHHAAGSGGFAAIAEKQIDAAGGAESAGRDVGGADAGFGEDGAVRGDEIKAHARRRRLVPGRHHGEPWKGVRVFAGRELFVGAVKPGASVRELSSEILDDIGADFVTTLADPWAERGA